MHLLIFCQGWRVFQRFFIFCLTLGSVDLLGVGQQGRLSSRKIYPPSVEAGYCSGVFSLTRCILQQLGCLIYLDSQTSLIWTPWGLARFPALAVLWVSALLPRGIIQLFHIWFLGLQSGMRNLMIIPALSDIEDTYLYYRRFLSFHWVSFSMWRILSGGVLGAILVPWFPSDKRGSGIFGGTISLIVASLPTGLVVHWQRRFHWVIFHSLLRDLFLWPSYSVEEVRFKYR